MSLIVAALLLVQDLAGADLVKKAVATTQAQKSFETTFKSRFVPPESKGMGYEGRQVWVAPGVLYMGVTGSGGVDKKIIRTGDKVWIHGGPAGWVDAADFGDDGAARGIQHPVEILEVLGGQAAAATRTKSGASMTLTGDALRAALKKHIKEGVAWEKSTAKVEISVDGEGRLKTLSCDASLESNNPQLQGKTQYTMEVSLIGFNTVTELKFTDEKDRPIDPGKAIQARIAQQLEGGK